MKIEYKFSKWANVVSSKGAYNKKPSMSDIKTAIKNGKIKTENGTIHYSDHGSFKCVVVVKAVSNGFTCNKYEDLYDVIEK